MPWPWLALVELIWIAAVSVWIITERRAPTATIAWIVVLALLPLVGLPIYFLIGPRYLERKQTRYAGLARRMREALARVTATKEIAPDTLRQVKLALRLDQSSITTATRLAMHHSGQAAFRAVETAMAKARETLHVEFYIFDEDRTGGRFRDLLTDRALAGVEVRLLLDGVGASAGDRFFAPLIDAGGKVKRFNPPRFGARFRLLNFRTHRKLVLVDGRVGFLGGMNVSDLQTIGRKGVPPWRDSMFEAEGRVVHGMQRAFLENWCFACGTEVDADPRYFPEMPAGQTWMQIVRSGPDRAVYPIHEFLFTAIASADTRVWITCPYLVPDEPIFTAIRSAAHRGVDVRLLVSRKSDSRLVDAAVRSYYDEWLAAGARVFEYLPAMLHGKTIVIDEELAILGSANLDNRSFRLNFEIIGAIYGKDSARALATTFRRDLRSAQEVVAAHRRNLRFRHRLAEDAARLFAIQL